MTTFTLASQSRWRKILLEKTGVPISILKSNYEEDMEYTKNPHILAKHLAHEKAQTVSLHTKNIIISADTFIIHNDCFLGKPHTIDNAINMLNRIQNTTIHAITGVCILCPQTKKTHLFSTQSSITMKKLSLNDITKYAHTGEALLCAGAFSLSQNGATLIKSITGSYTNVIGLPMHELENILVTHFAQQPFSVDVEKWIKNKIQLSNINH